MASVPYSDPLWFAHVAGARRAIQTQGVTWYRVTAVHGGSLVSGNMRGLSSLLGPPMWQEPDVPWMWGGCKCLWLLWTTSSSTLQTCTSECESE